MCMTRRREASKAVDRMKGLLLNGSELRVGVKYTGIGQTIIIVMKKMYVNFLLGVKVLMSKCCKSIRYIYICIIFCQFICNKMNLRDIKLFHGRFEVQYDNK